MTNKTKKTIYLAGDHAAFELKEKIKKYLAELGHTIKDFGPYKYNPNDDYPDFVIPAARAVAAVKKSPSIPPFKKGETGGFGIFLGGSGIGECIAANKVKGVRAVRAWNTVSAKMSRFHNNANVLCLGGGQTVDKTQNVGLTFAQAKKIIDTFLVTPFSNETRHVRRLKKVEK